MLTRTERNPGLSEKKKFRIRLRLHYTWLFLFIFIIATVATQYPESYTLYRRVLLGLVASLIFLLMIIIKQLCLNSIAISRNVIFRRVTVYIFGGVPGITREYTSPIYEILLGTAGLMLNIFITIFLYAIYVVMVIIGNTIFGNLAAWLSFAFFFFAVTQFIPAYPLDGGRIMRALIWRFTKDYDRATQISTWVGQGIGIAGIVIGTIFLLLQQEWLSGIFLILMGWAVIAAAVKINKDTSLRQSLKGVTILETMSRQYPHVAPQMSVAKIIREYSLVSGQYYFMVVSEDKLLGSLGLKNLHSIPRRSRERTKVSKIMIPANNFLTSYSTQPAADAYEQMSEMGFDEMPVIGEGKVIGVVFFDRLHRLATIKTELRM